MRTRRPRTKTAVEIRPSSARWLAPHGIPGHIGVRVKKGTRMKRRLCALLGCVLTMTFVIGCSESARSSVSPSAVAMASALTGGLEDTAVGGDKVSLQGSNKLSLISNVPGAAN